MKRRNRFFTSFLQASKFARLKILERDSRLAFIVGKRVAAKKLKDLYQQHQEEGTDDEKRSFDTTQLTSNSTKTEEYMLRSPKHHINEENEDRIISFTQLQHYHVLCCLEKIAVSMLV